MKLKNYTALTLLKKGCAIEFPSGYRLRGEPDTGYIQLKMPGDIGDDGIWILDREGTDNAIRDAEKYGKEGEE